MSLKPLEDKIVVKRNKVAEEKSSSGLIITTNKEVSNEGVVVAVGPGITLQDGSRIVPDVKPGDIVIFSPYGGTEISHNGEDFLVITIRDLFAVIEE
jgi:chaperonin GroES